MGSTLEYMGLVPFIPHPELDENIQNSQKNNQDQQELITWD